MSQEYLVIEQRLKGILNEVANSWSDITYLIFEVDELKHENVDLLIRTSIVASKVVLMTSTLNRQDDVLKDLKEILSKNLAMSPSSHLTDEWFSTLDLEGYNKDKWQVDTFDSDKSTMYLSSSLNVDLDKVLRKNALFEYLLDGLIENLVVE